HDLGQPGRPAGPRRAVRLRQGRAADRPPADRPPLRRIRAAAHRRDLRGRDRLAPEATRAMSPSPAVEPVIGLEVHAELLTRANIFCACSAAFGAPPNPHVCPVCLGMPGVLPVLNRRVVEYAIRAGLATHCAIVERSRFARKNYFYPDLCKGYQISMY